MSELMTPIPFRELMTWITTEYRRDGAVFGVHKPYKAGVKKLPIFGEAIETPFGPAAGPNTQLAQNIIAGYFAGARFFELKTVQKMDGADLAACINRPCILAEDECYNCEWSTELYVQQAFEEYVKAWCALKIMAKVYGLGDPNGFVFNMSVGYDLAGIQGEKIDTFLNGMVDASKTPIFQECIAVLKEFFPGESDYIDTITPHVSGSVTVSTLHGCPPDEIERIASYLLEKKHLHTFVKCNPTILGYDSSSVGISTFCSVLFLFSTACEICGSTTAKTSAAVSPKIAPAPARTPAAFHIFFLSNGFFLIVSFINSYDPSSLFFFSSM